MIRQSLHITRYPLAAVILVLGGCNVTSYFDPSKTGRFESTPTTIPILDRIDVIERDPDPWAKASPVTPDDLLPSDLTYRLSPGDVITVEIFELLMQGEVWSSSRRIDASGRFRLPAPIGDIRAAGLTTQEFQDEVVRVVDERVMRSPMVNVVVEQGAGFNYTIYGAVASTGIYTLPSAEHRVLDALAMAGGVPLITTKIYIIRQVPLTSDVIFEPGRQTAEPTPAPPGDPPADIEDLIRQLEQPQRPSRPPPPQQPPTADDVAKPIEPTPAGDPQRPPIDIEELLQELDRSPATGTDEAPVDVDDLIDEPGGHVAPGAYYQESGPPIDIEDLEPIQVPSPPAFRQRQETIQPPAVPPPAVPLPPTAEDTYIYVPERDEWVPVKAEAPPPPAVEQLTETEPQQDLFVARIIEIPFQRLKQGESSYNVVIRPKDRIYVAEPRAGVIYIDGEISRPGVYSMPASGKLTLSRLVAAAGGLGPLAIPERVDLTRIVGEDREASIRLNLGAIRKKTEPDLYLKPDDHIIIGTDFWAVPLAVFRSGLRMTYGFGFLLDRNFGNDVFGAPPTNFQR
ncbi:MAG: polysaccharide biosynthesis/export family protein [Planctomycetota bacterium]|jgi:protein involved in polysaccharide export with SLBB domain